MELELHRVDLLQTAGAAPGTLVVLPPGEKKTQKVAVGDCSGVVQCFSVKRGDVALSFKTMPGPQKVTSVSLGLHPRQRDKIFVASGPTVRGMTKKGKDFFRFTTSLTEPISRLVVADRDVWASCEFVHSHYVEARDKGLYLAPDRILAGEVIPLLGPGAFVPVLACRDRTVRVLDPDCAAPLFEVPTPSPPTSLLYVPDSHDPRHRFPAGSHELLYGCEDGRVVQLMVERGAVRQGFTIPPPPGAGAVRSLHCGADYSKSGCADIVLGREDGWLEVWDVDEMGQPHKVFATQLLESICTVDGGYITSAAAAEIVVQTFTGKVIAFSPNASALALGAGPAAALAPQLGTVSFKEGRASSGGGAGSGGGGITAGPVMSQHQQLVAALHARIAKTTAEVDELRKRVEKERARAANRPVSGSALGPSNVLDVSHSLKLQVPGAGSGGGGGAGPGEAAAGAGGASDGGACYALAIESAAPLFAVGLASSRELLLQDSPGNVAILSKATPTEGSGWATLATYRCQDATNRLTISFKLQEGQSGTLQAFVVPAIPPKTCALVQYRLAPLCLHQRISTDVIALWEQQRQQQGQQGQQGQAADESQRLPFSEMVLSGSFTLHQINSWVASALPDLPPHAPSGACAEVRYSFRSCQAASVLGCCLAAGTAQFVSDNISSLALLHDSLMRSATADKVRASSSFSVHPRSLEHAAQLLWPDLTLQRGRARRVKLLQALQELRLQDGDVDYLAPEYKAMLDQASKDAGAGPGRPPGTDGAASAAVADAGNAGSGGARVGAGAGAPQEQSAAEAMRQLFRDHCRLGGGRGGGGGGGVKARMPGLDALLQRAGDPGAGLSDVVAYMLGAQ